jgi:hypothetical protein
VSACLVLWLSSTLPALGDTKTELKIRTLPRTVEQAAQQAPVEPAAATQLQLAAPIRPVQLPSRTRLAVRQAGRQAARQVNLQNPQPGTIPQADAVPQPGAVPQQGTISRPGPAPIGAPPVGEPQVASSKDPCAAMNLTPMVELGIYIGPTEGELPTNYAETCWEPFNQSAGPFAGARSWGPSQYLWDATCLCHRPLYFEEINLERYGYGCCECLQPAASAAHFFATVPALPYCMAVECPCECVYTLGHYRPGSCPPWRWHWPPCTIPAAATEIGVIAGLILIFP